MNGLNEIFPPVKFIKVLNFTDKTWLVRYSGEVSVKIGISGEGNGNPLQYSCLENPLDRGSWWATVHGVAVGHDWATDTHKIEEILDGAVHFIYSPISCRQHLGGKMAPPHPPPPNPFWKSWGLSACQELLLLSHVSRV